MVWWNTKLAILEDQICTIREFYKRIFNTIIAVQVLLSKATGGNALNAKDEAMKEQNLVAAS